MLFKLKHIFNIILILTLIAACQSKKNVNSLEKAEQYKARLDKKKRGKHRKSREKAREKQYNIQSKKTKENWDLNKQKSENWRNKEFHKNPFSYKIRKFFDNFRRKPKPEEGLFSKRQKRKKKGTFLGRIFKKNRKKK